MKTVIMRDIIEKVATPEQLQNMHDALTPPQYYDLMMNNGTGDSKPEDIGVLGKEHDGSKDYIKALTAHLGKNKKFWENANTLVLNVNKEISSSDRMKFPLVDRIIDDKLITMLENGVPSNEDALNCVTEDVVDGNNLLSQLINEAVPHDSWVSAVLTIEGVEAKVHIGAEIEQFALHYQSSSSLVINILKEFRSQGTTEIHLGKVFLDKYVEPNSYYGNLETELLSTTFTITKAKDEVTKSMCQHLFLETSAVRYEATENKPLSIPDELIVKMHPDAWRTLLAKCVVENR